MLLWGYNAFTMLAQVNGVDIRLAGVKHHLEYKCDFMPQIDILTLIEVLWFP